MVFRHPSRLYKHDHIEGRASLLHDEIFSHESDSSDEDLDCCYIVQHLWYPKEHKHLPNYQLIFQKEFTTHLKQDLMHKPTRLELQKKNLSLILITMP